MKRLIYIFTSIIILSVLPVTAAAAPPDWTPVPIPGPGGDSAPVFFDTDSYIASDIALDVNGNLYVMSGSRIIRFTQQGKTDTSWGKNGIIYDPDLADKNSGQLMIAADSRGYVYALCRIEEDGNPTFVKRYTPDGKADAAWYGDGIMGGKFVGEVLAADETESPAGLPGGDEIATDSMDNLYVLHDRQVYRFLTDGKPDTKWRKVLIRQPEKVSGEGGGAALYSNAMRIDRKDNLYLYNGHDRIVSKYSNTGRSLKRQRCPLYYAQEDDLGNKTYLINKPAFDAEGKIYQVNPDGRSISRYSPKMKLDHDWCGGALTVGKDPGPVQTISDLEMDASGNIYILDEENRVVSRYLNDGVLDKGWGIGGSLGSVNGEGKAVLGITDIICDIDGSMYALSDDSGDEASLIVKIDSDFTLGDSWGADASGSFKGYKTDASNSMAAYNGNLYVEPDTEVFGVGYNGIKRLGSEGVMDEWGITANGPVWGLQTDGNGNIYVAEEQITKYLPDGSVDESWGRGGNVERPDIIGEMTVDSSGYLYVSSRSDNSILRYTPEGHSDINWGDGGKADIPAAAEGSAAYDSYFIAADNAGNLYLSDYLNNRILRYDNSGQPDTSWCGGGEWRSGSGLSDLDPLIRPTHLMIRRGRLYAIWNGGLFVMSDSVARVGIKPILIGASGPAEEAASAAYTPDARRWAVSIAGVLFCAGAITAMILLLPKKNKRRRMAKIKSIKIAKRTVR